MKTVRETREWERSQDLGTQLLKEKSSLPLSPKVAGNEEGTGDDPIGTGPDSPRLGVSFHHNFFKSECLLQCVGQSSWIAENSWWALFCSIQTYSPKRFAANPQDILEVAGCGIDCCFSGVKSFLFFIPWEIICHAYGTNPSSVHQSWFIFFLFWLTLNYLQCSSF